MSVPQYKDFDKAVGGKNCVSLKNFLYVANIFVIMLVMNRYFL